MYRRGVRTLPLTKFSHLHRVQEQKLVQCIHMTLDWDLKEKAQRDLQTVRYALRRPCSVGFRGGPLQDKSNQFNQTV